MHAPKLWCRPAATSISPCSTLWYVSRRPYNRIMPDSCSHQACLLCYPFCSSPHQSCGLRVHLSNLIEQPCTTNVAHTSSRMKGGPAGFLRALPHLCSLLWRPPLLMGRRPVRQAGPCQLRQLHRATPSLLSSRPVSAARLLWCVAHSLHSSATAISGPSWICELS